MKAILAIPLTLALCAIAGATDIPATGNADGSVSFRLTKEQWAECEAGGGCLMVPLKRLEESVKAFCGTAI